MSNSFRKKKKSTQGRNTRSSAGAEASKSTEPLFSERFSKDQFSLVAGAFFLVLSVLLLLAFVSYLFSGYADQDIIQGNVKEVMADPGKKPSNILGYFGAYLSHWFIFRWFGVASFFIIPILFFPGFRLVFGQDPVRLNLNRLVTACIFYLFFTAIFLGFWVFIFDFSTGALSGGIGYQVNEYLFRLFGKGSILLILFILFCWTVFFHGMTRIDDYLIGRFFARKPRRKMVFDGPEEQPDDIVEAPVREAPPAFRTNYPITEEEEVFVAGEKAFEVSAKQEEPLKTGISFTIEKSAEEPAVEDGPAGENPRSVYEEDSDQLLSEFGPYDPKLDLSGYIYPPLNLLSEYNNAGSRVTEEELEANKDKIIKTINNFQIGISSIKATIGPTVTLYEIVPDAGVRISKIKNLEDDIALNLAALGIRIIAPMPGKGTIGIEVPNKNREMVSIKSVLSSEKFQKSAFELPVVLGKTISNELYVADLAKMPHLLMAGATGQGKSVGLNAILVSLLYKKHPAEVKFVLVDPKKVELTLFNKIERHFLAMLPNAEEAIITDTKKVINTLNSLCIEMDNRYNLLKEAGVRNIKEYNAKFTHRKLNPEKGHKFLPYIVLVIDELADLMMTAGKEVEQPIARLAQLARAIGIHLIVATQRPSVNVITGLIKANFPARLSFKVTAKVDSRTILDTGGSEQLVGNGDMLLSTGSDMVRLQCPFVDTPEVEGVCEYIGSQRAYEYAYLLPEYYGDDEPDGLDFDPSELDPLFDEAARLLVVHQQGSTSLIQRKMKLGYNRAGRIIDQLEGAGIVGAFEGSKAREVLIKDLEHLEEILKGFKRN